MSLAIKEASTSRKHISTLMRQLCFGVQASRDPSISHAFDDATHNACCLLGPKSREGSDETGNPIGSSSKALSGKRPFVSKDAMSAWSTCMGSSVCSFYGQKYKDAYMKFAVSPDKRLMYLPTHGTILSPACEHFLNTEVFQGGSHRTPGVPAKNGNCSREDR